MTDPLLKLHAWLSPGYPVGAYTYSHGLEAAIEGGLVADAATLADWVADCLTHGAGRSDAILLAHAWRAPEDDAVAELAAALAPSAERLLEAEAQGAAFAAVTEASWGGGGDAAPYPVAIGRAAAANEVALDPAVKLYLQAFAANLVSAAVRLIPLGQTEGQQVLAGLSTTIEAVAAEAITAPLDAIGGCAIGADIASMRHETQTVRLFRS